MDNTSIITIFVTMDNLQASQNTKNYIKHNKDNSHPNFPHSTFAGYKAGCKCMQCLTVGREYKRLYNKNLKLTNEKYLLSQRQNKKEYRLSEKGKAICNNYAALRRSKEKLQVLTDKEKELLILIYKFCSKEYHVDHIIPISLGGLHHPDNLQYLPKEMNLKKHNSLDFDYEGKNIFWQPIILEASTTNE